MTENTARLAGTYTLLGAGEKVMTFARQALETDSLDAAAASQVRSLVAVGALQVPARARAWRSCGTWRPTRREWVRWMSTA